MLECLPLQKMKAARHPLLLFCPFLVIALLTWPSLVSNSSFITVEQTSSVTHQANHQNINSCLPLYSLIRRHLNTSLIEKDTTKYLFIVAAYDFGDYSVVTMKTKGIRRLYCHYMDKNWHPLGDPVETIVFPNFVAHCCKRHGAHYMTVSTEIEVSLAQFVPVFDRTKDEPKFGLSVCLSPIFGEQSSWLLLTELIEHYKLYGVQHFYLYVQAIDEYSEKVLRSYVKSGEAEAVYIGDENDELTSQFQVAAIQDCLHRSRHQSRYTLFADLDERVITIGNNNLYDYAVKTLGKNITRGALCFKTRAILRTSPLPKKYGGGKTLIDHLPTLVYHNTSANPVDCFMCRCMVDPKMIFHMHIHTVTIFFSPEFELLEVPASDGVIRHYREPTGEGWEKEILPKLRTLGSFERTYYPAQLIDRLYNNVKERLDFVYKLNSTFNSNNNSISSLLLL